MPKLGVIMDPIGSIKSYKDSTFAMLLEAQRRGWPVIYMEQYDLFSLDGQTHARMRSLTVHDDNTHWHDFGDEWTAPLHDLDVILMRKDPPFDTEYIYTTYLLERSEAMGALVINRPQSLRDINEKLSTALFPECTPPNLVTRQASQVREFLAEHNDIILKPLGEMGGASIFRLKQDDPNINVAIETLTRYETRFVMVQRYIPEIKAGDKRILLINGEPVTYALARMPTKGETRANLAAGGKGVGIELSDRDRWICEQVGPYLRDKGVVFAGLDVIGDYLTEINITSPTCIRELDGFYHLNIAGQLFDAIETKLGTSTGNSSS